MHCWCASHPTCYLLNAAEGEEGCPQIARSCGVGKDKGCSKEERKRAKGESKFECDAAGNRALLCGSMTLAYERKSKAVQTKDEESLTSW
jgi:hypothetical protein